MRLKSLEIQGFKSFPDRTVIRFGSDITAIVGPNGSGKSNISDAICWVLGEQSTKALRGGKMEDVIFGGTQKRAPVGFAEATLVLDNQDGSLAADTPEVMVTRRYYRSGESEYFINKQQARLRDINELFMDTGLGKEGYSNIGQGKIDEILSLKSTERREIFEEAAGISKYRHRKEETERRLASTEDNLLRIGDKISELELQVEPLKVQAEKAQNYLKFRDELKGLEITVWLDSLSKLAESVQKAEADYEASAAVLEQAHEELKALYAAAEELSEKLNAQTVRLDTVRDEITAFDTNRQNTENQVSLLQAAVTHHEQTIAHIRQELADEETRSGGISQTIEQHLQRIVAIERELNECESKKQILDEKEKNLSAECTEMEQQKISIQTKQSMLLSQSAEYKAELASLNASMQEVEERRNLLEQDHAAAQTRKQDASAQQAECIKRLNDAEEAVQEANNRISGYTLRQKTRKEKVEDLSNQIASLKIELDTIDSKMRMLQEMERDFEGFGKAEKLVLLEAERGGLKNIHGPVSSLLRADDSVTMAIETALGGAMQNIVVSTEEDGKAVLQMLKRRDGGRVTCLPLSAIRGKRIEADDVSRMTGFVGIASQLVRFDEKYRNIVEYLLGRTVIIDHIDNAIKMARQTGNRFRIVTLDGQVMNAGGSMTGGSASKHSGVLARANAIERYAAKQKELQENLETLQAKLKDAQSALSETDFQLTTAQADLRKAEDTVLQRGEEKKQIALLLDALEENLSGYQAELDRLVSRSGGDEGKKAILTKKAGQTDKQLADLERELAVLSEKLEEVTVRKNALADEQSALQLQETSKQTEKQSAENAAQDLRNLQASMRGGRSQKEQLIQQEKAEILKTQQQMEALKAEAAELGRKAGEKRQQLSEEAQARSELERLRSQTEKDAQAKNQEIMNLERETTRLESQKATGELEQKQLFDKLWEQYQLTPSTAEKETVEVQSIAAANRQIADVRRKMNALGTPNLGAIDEYERVSERYDYLTGQRDDVLHAKKELEAIVNSITEEMTDIFVREFEKMNTYFGQTFTEMFGGGKGVLLLEDPANPLTCGIEIHVQPPGKQVKTITLLSGGEKAFVAIALYFAILKVRPSPFCMLDEIDAALDDRNVERFAQYLRNLQDKTQFIVITHRRGTMEAAEILYGVTMQEQGISKILHLDLDELSKQLGITA